MMQKDGKSTHLRTESDSNQLSDLNIINSQKTVEIFKTGSEAGHHFETINDTIKVSGIVFLMGSWLSFLAFFPIIAFIKILR